MGANVCLTFNWKLEKTDHLLVIICILAGMATSIKKITCHFQANLIENKVYIRKKRRQTAENFSNLEH